MKTLKNNKLLTYSTIFMLLFSAILISASVFKIRSYFSFLVYMKRTICINYNDLNHRIFLPSCNEYIPLKGRVIRLSTNEITLRERPLKELKPQQVFIVGDSVIEGMGVQFEEAFPQVFEKEIGKELGLQFINLGVRRSSPFIQVNTIKQIAKTLKPKYIIWSLTENDFNEDFYLTALAHKFDQYKIPIHFSRHISKRTWASELVDNFVSALNPYSSDYTTVLRFLYFSRPYYNAASRWSDFPALCQAIEEGYRYTKEVGIKLQFMIVPFSPDYYSLHQGEGDLKNKLSRIVSCLRNKPFDLRVPPIGNNPELFQEDLMHLTPEGVRVSVQHVKEDVKNFLK